MALLNPFLGFAAGALTILSPCVLPLVPIVLGSAAQKHRFGPFALAFGLVASFTTIGMAVAILGPALGFNGEGLRIAGALVLVAAGLTLVVPAMQTRLTSLATPLANWANARQVGLDRFGLAGQAAIGALLGVVWSPCVGPTLGAATALAAQGQDIGQVAVVMLAFALGIATVLLALAFASRGLLARWRGRLLTTGSGGKRALGMVLAAVGLFIVTGLDRSAERVIVSASPDWLINVTTAF
ncbi:cytochrome c biogenesis CcdA family protein [Novosphingobium sp.]|uniref:cytochrome c biogenesis CcdA family protein n=1 Tax=Novosphingobium sp. TaxID=1874826 RepID=UPI00334025F6